MDGSGLSDGTFEWNVLKRVEGVVVNKNADGALSREEVCSMMNRIVETADSLASAIGALFMVMVSRHTSEV